MIRRVVLAVCCLVASAAAQQPISCTAASCAFNLAEINGTALGAPANFGTSPGAVVVQGVNASLAIGTTMVSASAPVPISATAAANSKTNPFFTSIADSTNQLTAAISALGTAPTGTEVMAVNAVNLPTTASGGALSASVKATVTSSVNVKASAGNVYGISVANGAAVVCWVQFINSASAGTLGTAVIFSVALPISGVVNIAPGALALGNFSSGIAVGVASSTNSSTACGTGANLTVWYE